MMMNINVNTCDQYKETSIKSTSTVSYSRASYRILQREAKFQKTETLQYIVICQKYLNFFFVCHQIQVKDQRMERG